MTLRGLIALGRTALEDAANADMASIGAAHQGIADIVAASGVVDIDSARIAVTAIVVLGLLWFCFKDEEFRASKADVVAGIIIGLCVPAGWVITGIIGFDDFAPTQLASLTFVAPVANSIQYLMTFTGATIDFGIATVGGVIVGSFLSAIGGAVLMGVGGVLALGCTIGQGLTGLSTLAIGSVIAFLSIVFGGVLGMKYIEEGEFGAALKAVFSRE